MVKNIKVAILGFGLQGRSSYKYYKALGHQVTICDLNSNLPDPPAQADLKLGSTYLNDLDQFDLLVRTPVLQPEKIAAANPDSPRILDKMTTASNEFFRQVKTPIIAITGTKGKGTTSFLSQAILEAAGLKVCLVGNIGIPPLDVVTEAQEADVVVFEIASFQTMDLQYSPQIGVCLNISPDHLDWHKDYDDYVNCKAQLFAHQNKDNKAVFFASSPDASRAVSRSPALKMSYAVREGIEADVHVRDGAIYFKNEFIIQTKDIAIIGRHNWQNVCAAVAACYDFLPADSASRVIASVLRDFTNPPNRLELVRRLHQVRYINDSFATVPEPTIAALESIDGPKILIAGGRDKGTDMNYLVDKILSGNVKHLITIGPKGEEIARLIKEADSGFSVEGNCLTMAAAVQDAFKHARAGDVVLLSPANASHEIFKNASDRAEQFKTAVAKLK